MDNGANITKVKMSGYLYLKTKKRMISSWKNYWFVLEDRLLLYYRSRTEYEAISPCKGCLNLGPPCTVKSLPSVPNSFQLETRTVTYTLKAENPEDQKKWMQNILSALNQNQNFSTESPKRLSHFRYSLDDLIPKVEPNDSQVLQNKPFERQNTMPHRLKLEAKKSNEIIQRLQKMGAQSYGGSLGAISKMVTKKATSPTLPKDATTASKGSLPDYFEENEEVLRHRRVCGDNIYERISGDSDYSNRGSFLVDNENYSVPTRRVMTAGEREAHEKNVATPTRETKSLMVENDNYATTRHVHSDEVIYAEPKINVTDCNKNSVLVDNLLYATADGVSQVSSNENENLYEDLDKFSHYSQPIIKKVDETSSQKSEESKAQTKKNKKSEQKDKPLKKSKSFIGRMWRRKNKKQEKVEKSKEDAIYAEVDAIAVEKVTLNDGGAIQMLSELHNILENKKTKLMASNPNISVDVEHSESEQKTNSSTTSTSNSELVCPSLPPKTHKMLQETISDQPIEQIRSIDEILEDLDKEKVEAKSKVKMLIEKFSESETDVVLRKHDKSDFKIYRHSDDLNKLLDELTKVTSAPIMTPGVTSSLVNPNLTDAEWLRLLPVRQRRLSEPDYDVPRPHKPIEPPTMPENSDAIPATRFFGPVLPSTDTKEDSLPVSMTPDSLEVEDQQKFQTLCSYTSHNYNHNQSNLKCFPHNYNQEDDKVIYAMPKSYISVATHIVNTCQNICGAPLTEECTIIYKNVKNVEIQDEIFKDSLELCNETSTEF